MMIYVLFEPLTIKEREFEDVPVFEINSFIMYELNEKGLKTLMTGDKTLKYEDRYTVDTIDFTDQSKGFISNMKADRGLYKEDIVNLNGDIRYVREDGLMFQSEAMTYNTTTAVANTTSSYTASKNKSTMTGTSLEYHSIPNTMKSKNIVIKYQLEDNS